MKKLLTKFWFLFPSRLPIGMTQWKKWSKDIISTYPLPQNESSEFALATMILHSPASKFYRSKWSFARDAMKSMSNQIASQVMLEIKEKRAAMEAEIKRLEEVVAKEKEEEQKAAATANTEAGNEQAKGQTV